MSIRLTSRMLVSALVRRAHAEGGHAMVLRHGDDGAGTVLLQCVDRGRFVALIERQLDHLGRYRWARCGPADDEGSALAAYIDRRRARDPDLWLVELDIVEPERFAAETIGET
ncbi:hypothetical protein FHS96_001949 [Sphingomonas zeicaulis]|uniref:DUF1491 family protein n=1 Tax=Sphingomonas zeicaulis TaxID=1632740 RepID=UPI003D255F19